MYLSILLGAICDQDIAKQCNYTPDDFINKPKEDLKDFTTKNVLKLLHPEDANYFNFVKTNYNDKFFNCNTDPQTNIQNTKIKSRNNNDGLQQLINIINLIQNIQKKPPEPKPDNKSVEPENNDPEELMDESETNKPDEPMNEPETNKPDEPIDELKTKNPDELMDEPESEPDYDLIFNIIEKKIKLTTRTEAVKLLDNKSIFDKIENSELKKQDKTRLHQLYRILTALQISNSLKSINEKIKLINAKKEFDKIAEKIKNENNVLKLNTDIKNEIDFKTEYITEDQKKELHRLLTNKIFDDLKNSIRTEHYAYQLEDDNHYDQKSSPKRLAPENDQPTTEYPNRNTDNAAPIRNDRETAIVQINFIINEYKKTLNADDLKKFGRVQTNEVCNKIQKAHNNAKDRKTLLDILYYIWVLDKNDQFLLSKKYIVRKINKAKKLAD
ncbi:922_t:CDS:2, partial [Dentiscutata heterogama]